MAIRFYSGEYHSWSGKRHTEVNTVNWKPEKNLTFATAMKHLLQECRD